MRRRRRGRFPLLPGGGAFAGPAGGECCVAGAQAVLFRCFKWRLAFQKMGLITSGCGWCRADGRARVARRQPRSGLPAGTLPEHPRSGPFLSGAVQSFPSTYLWPSPRDSRSASLSLPLANIIIALHDYGPHHFGIAPQGAFSAAAHDSVAYLSL